MTDRAVQLLIGYQMVSPLLLQMYNLCEEQELWHFLYEVERTSKAK
jgi:hypothetical protein